MVWVRKIFGFVLIGMAVYFLEPLFPDKKIYYYILALTALIAGIYLGWLEKTSGSSGFKTARYITGVIFVLLAVVLVFPSNPEKKSRVLWQVYDEQLLMAANEEGKPVVIDFYADWCIPCKELDNFTFTDTEVIILSKKFVRLKKDLTQFESDTRQRYSIKGVPTIVFIGADGNEIEALRLTGFEDAVQFAERMKKALQ